MSVGTALLAAASAAAIAAGVEPPDDQLADALKELKSRYGFQGLFRGLDVLAANQLEHLGQCPDCGERATHIPIAALDEQIRAVFATLIPLAVERDRLSDIWDNSIEVDIANNSDAEDPDRKWDVEEAAVKNAPAPDAPAYAAPLGVTFN